MSEIEILTEFKKQLINFFDELIAQFPQEGDLVIVRLFISNQMETTEVMNIFISTLIKNNNEFRTMIKMRNENFFLDYDIFDLFNMSSQKAEKVSHFKKIWRSGQLDKEDKDVIWRWLDTFIYLADKYTRALNKKQN
jgi:hypothetical protein